VLHGTMVQKNDCWILESSTGRQDPDLDHHVRDLLAVITPRKKEIQGLASECLGRVTLVGYFNHANDGFRLTAPQVALIAEMGLAVDCDLYFIGDEEEPNQSPEPTPTVRPFSAP